MTTLKDEIVATIQEICYPNTPDLSDENRELIESNMDSLDWASSLMAIEDKYNFEVSEDDLQTLITLRAIIDYVENAIGK